MGAVTLPNGGVPLDCAVDNFGNVTVADSLNSRLVKYTWNLTYLDSYGTYGVGASNDNTLAHPHAVDVPFGYKGGPIQGWAWFGDGRVITAEDWGTQSGAREHYLGINSWITAQPFLTSTWHWDFSYNVTDHAEHQGVTVIDANGNVVRSGLAPTGLQPPGSYTADWDGHTDAGSFAGDGNYRFRVRLISAYGCSGSSWCDQTLTSSSFLWSPVTVSGPSSITTAGTYTWTANPSYGTPPYTYQWQYRNVGSQTWNSLGTGQSQSRSIASGTPSFDIQVTMSWASGGGWADMSVDNSGGGCGPCSPTCKC